MAASALLVAVVVSLMVAIEVRGNHAINDGSQFGTLVAIGMALIFALGGLLLGSLLLNVPGRWTWLKTAGLLLLVGIEAQTWVWLRAGFEACVHASDKIAVVDASAGAWEATLAELESDVHAALTETPAQAEARANCIQLRESIAQAVRNAADMDNDGVKENDGLIPGQLALIESLKADLANEESRTERLAKSDTRHADAVAALSAHRATRVLVAASGAETVASVHQFQRWAGQLAPIIGWKTESALELILAMVTTGWLIVQYGGLVCLNLSARIPLGVPVPEPAPVTPPKGRRRANKPAPVSAPAERSGQLELLDAPVNPRYESQRRWLNRRAKLRCAAVKTGLPREETDRMGIEELEQLAA